MPVTISYDNPRMMKDEVVEIMGVCAIPNGGSVEVDDDTLAMYEKAHDGQKLQDAYKKNKFVKITHSTEKKEVKNA